MLYEGVIRKMESELGNPIQYYLDFPNDVVNVNQLIGKNIQISNLRKKSIVQDIAMVAFSSYLKLQNGLSDQN